MRFRQKICSKGGREVMENTNCEHCTGRPLLERKNLMANNRNDYRVFINECNYLEDSVIGNTVPYSLLGVKINFCPMCGRELGERS